MIKRSSFKILVTGGAGFIGSEFVRQAVAQGYQVAVVDRLTYAGDRQRLKSIKGKYTFHKIDIVNQHRLADVLKLEKPQVFIHFAAESHVDRSILNDTPFVRTNISGTQSLLSVCRDSKVKRFIHISTDEVYGGIARGTFKEESPLSPSSPYAASKGAADLLVKSYIHTFNFPAIIIRPSNNYGAWQHPEKFIPLIIYKAIKGEKIPVYGQGLNVREWLHVSDCVGGILRIMEQGRLGETYNIGSGRQCNNIALVESILGMMGRPKHLISFVKDRAGHDGRYALDSGKLCRELSWEPKIIFEQGLANTIEWYQKNLRWLEKKVEH